MSVDLNITFLAVHCDDLHIDIMDAGDIHSNVDKTLTKRRLYLDGFFLSREEIKVETNKAYRNTMGSPPTNLFLTQESDALQLLYYSKQIVRIADEVDDTRMSSSGRQRLQWVLAINAVVVVKALVHEN